MDLPNDRVVMGDRAIVRTDEGDVFTLDFVRGVELDDFLLKAGKL